MTKVNSFSITSLILSLCGSSFFGISTSYLLFKSNTTVLLSMIIGFIISIFFIFIYLKFFNVLPDYTFASKMRKIFGKFGIIINLLLILISIFIVAALNYRLGKFLSSQYLIDTPPIYLNTFIILLICYISTKKVDTLTRVSIISFFICIAIFILDFTSLSGEIELTRLLPMFTVSIPNILLSSIVFSVFFSLPCFYINIINKNNIIDKERFNKSFIKVYILSFIILFLIVLATVSILGINLVNILSYPLYSVLKRINISSFIISVENVSIILWFLFEIIGTSAMLLFSMNMIRETFKIKKDIPLNIISYTLGIIMIIFPNYLFNQSLINTSFKMLITPIICFSLLFLICLVSLIVYQIRKKKIN